MPSRGVPLCDQYEFVFKYATISGAFAVLTYFVLDRINIAVAVSENLTIVARSRVSRLELAVSIQ